MKTHASHLSFVVIQSFPGFSMKPNVTFPDLFQAIDVWVGVCTFFVFGALIEFAIVNLMARKDTKKALSHAQKGPDRDSERGNSSFSTPNHNVRFSEVRPTVP